MAQISLEDFYKGENAGKSYGIVNKVFEDLYWNDIPVVFDENEWIQMLYIKHTLIAAEQIRKRGDFVSGILDPKSPLPSVEV